MRKVAGIAVLASALVLTACSTPIGNATPANPGGASGAVSATSDTPTSSTPTVAPVAFQTNVPADAKNVAVDTRVTATASEGTLETVAFSFVSKKSGKTIDVPGKLDNGTWTAGDLLEPGVTYTVKMTAKDAAGETATKTNTFTTVPLTLDEQTYVKVTPESGVVGIGMPVIITFDIPVTDKANFEKHMIVTSSPAQAGAWRWISDTEAHWRPAKYWQPGTKVHVEASLNGVNAGNGIYGEQSRVADFTIGRAAIIKTNFATHRMDVYINGKLVKGNVPITGGASDTQTRSGIKVIMNKQRDIIMRAETIGYKKGDKNWYPDTPVPYALQITHSGEFLHSAPWSVAYQGVENVSHGCTGMSIANSKWLYDNIMVGDVVVASGTNRQMQLGNGYADWNLSFAQWKSGGAS